MLLLSHFSHVRDQNIKEEQANLWPSQSKLQKVWLFGALGEERAEAKKRTDVDQMSAVGQAPCSSWRRQGHKCEATYSFRFDFQQLLYRICVLKDFHTITAVPYGLTYLNLSGNHGMATGGSGDVLAGVIGALLAQVQMEVFKPSDFY